MPAPGEGVDVSDLTDALRRYGVMLLRRFVALLSAFLLLFVSGISSPEIILHF